MTLEILYRERSHWTMLVLAGLIFIVVGLLNEMWQWDVGLIRQVITGTAIATVGEFVTGCIVNLWLGWNVWDYSELPFNILGQITPQFILLWIPIILIAIILDDIIRWKFFLEEKPRYWIGGYCLEFK